MRERGKRRRGLNLGEQSEGRERESRGGGELTMSCMMSMLLTDNGMVEVGKSGWYVAGGRWQQMHASM